eukprot:Skav200859  [mRNA]  locus=scaffold71:22866:25264:- [translate_table: standard]
MLSMGSWRSTPPVADLLKQLPHIQDLHLYRLEFRPKDFRTHLKVSMLYLGTKLMWALEALALDAPPDPSSPVQSLQAQGPTGAAGPTRI